MLKKMVMFGMILCLTLGASLTAAAPDTMFGWARIPTTLTFYGQSTFLLTHGEVKVLIDPWLDGNPWKTTTAAEVDAQYILISHAHRDHMGDAAAIAKRTGAKIIATAEITRLLAEQGVASLQPMSIGGKWNFEFGSVKVTNAVRFGGGGWSGGWFYHHFL